MNGSFRLRRKASGETFTGDAAACMAHLGLNASGFRRLLREARSGTGEWEAAYVETDWREEAARQWDRCFGWYPPYPCAGCVYRPLCEHEDWYCRDFSLWFRRRWDRNASELRRRNPRKT